MGQASKLRQSKREPDAFAAVYRSHARPVLVYLTRRTYDPELALELMAETFAQAFASRARFRGHSEGEEAAWLYGIAAHVLSRSLRRRRAETRALRRLGIQAPSGDGEDLQRIVELSGLAELRKAVEEGFSSLPSGQREAVRLWVIDELPYPLVAERLNISETNARARVSRGLRALEQKLEHQPLPECIT